MIVADARIRQKHRGHLLAVAVPHPKAPRASAGASLAAPLEERDLRDGTVLPQLFGATALVCTDAEVKVPWPEVDRKIAVRVPNLRRRLERDLEHRAFDTWPDNDRTPVGAEELLRERAQRFLGRWEVRICRLGVVGVLLDHVEAWICGLCLHRSLLTRHARSGCRPCRWLPAGSR